MKKRILFLSLLIVYTACLLIYLIDLYAFYICDYYFRNTKLIPKENVIGNLLFLLKFLFAFLLIRNIIFKINVFKSKIFEKWAIVLIVTDFLLFIFIIVYHKNDI